MNKKSNFEPGWYTYTDKNRVEHNVDIYATKIISKTEKLCFWYDEKSDKMFGTTTVTKEEGWGKDIGIIQMEHSFAQIAFGSLR